MIQTSFFQEIKKKPLIIDISSLQPRKLEEVMPEKDIVPDTYMIYPSGGFHPFYGVEGTFPIYQQQIWPYIKRIKFSDRFKSKEAIDKIRSGNMRNNILLTIDQVGSTLNQMGRVETGIDRNKTFTRVSNGREDHGRNPVTLHRASARAFIPNPDNHPVVMHFNDDSTNYLLENLLWGTSSDNNRGKKMRRPDTMEQKYANLIIKDVIKG